MPHQLIFIFAACLGFVTLASVEESVPTFSNDIAKIIHDKCTSCHRPESFATFSLISYRDVQQRAGTIEAVLEMVYMQLEYNHDGSLQRSKTPPRLQDRAFDFVDVDKSDSLDKSELENLLRLPNYFVVSHKAGIFFVPFSYSPSN